MNSIEANFDSLNNSNPPISFLNFKIDNEWLDEKLSSLKSNRPDFDFDGLVPTLLFWLEKNQDQEVVWNRILPKNDEVAVCPILMCPDDCDFNCSLVVTEIHNSNQTIKWNKIGIDYSNSFDSNEVGTVVEWVLEDFNFEFSKLNYLTVLNKFKEQFTIEETIFNQKNPQFARKLKIELF